MSRIDWLEIEGKRVNEADVKRVTEYRCDGCGEFIAEPIIMQIQFFAWRGLSASLPQYHLHPACMAQHLPFIVADLGRQGFEL